ncbi:DUF2270 domain-containing protein [soil metagenome]
MNKENKSGYSSSESVTAITHLYRGEMQRCNIWRTRLDVTTNWAIITSAAFLSIGFGGPDIPHFVLILATVFVLFFLIIESRRYKYYDIWRWRVAIINENFFSEVLSPQSHKLNENWREMLSEDLKYTYFKITFREAFGHRLRRNYSWIFLTLAICWITKISIHPFPVEHFEDLISRAAVFHILPGWLVILLGIIFNLFLIIIALITDKSRVEEIRRKVADKKELE